MDAEELYHELIAVLDGKGLDVPADADEMIADACLLIAKGDSHEST